MRSLHPMDDSSYRRLLIERRDHGVVLLTLSNPGKLNATDAVLHAELARVFHDISHDDTIRAVVVTGEGKAFSAGGDLDWIAEQVGNHAQTMKVMREAGDIVRTMIDCDTPIISAINGVAVGAGLAVALMADISIIDDDARFTDGHIRLGVGAGDHAVAIWPLLCGMAKAKYYLLTADFIDGREAERIGLVSKAVAADEVLPPGARHRREARPRATRRHAVHQAGVEPLAAPGAAELRGVARLRDAQLPRRRRGRGPRRPADQASTGVRPMTTTPPPDPPDLDQVVDGHDLAVELAFALKLATAADAVTLPHYEQRSFTPRLEGQPHRGDRGRPRERARDLRPRARRAPAPRPVRRGARRRRRSPTRRGGGSSTRSTARRTSCAASRCGRA